MKHLKSYKVFETKIFDNSNSDLLSVAKDTFLELEDEYYHVSISMFPHGVNAFIIDVSKSESFRWYDVNYYFDITDEYIKENNTDWVLNTISYTYIDIDEKERSKKFVLNKAYPNSLIPNFLSTLPRHDYGKNLTGIAFVYENETLKNI